MPEDWYQSFMPNFYKPAIRCRYCDVRNLECKVFLNEGNKSCFTCTSLFRGCSFVEKSEPTKNHHVDTLHSVSEDAIVEQGTLTGIRPTYTAGASLQEIKQEMERRGRCNGDPSNCHVGARFSKHIVRILKKWLDEHAEHPYPTHEEKEVLREQTGLNCLQISNWLANARRRGKVRPKRGTSPAIRNRSQPQDVPKAPEGYVPADREILTPFERWRDSPPESEAPLTAIARAAESTEFSVDWSGESSVSNSVADHRHSNSSKLSSFHAPSSTSLETGDSSVSRSSRRSMGSSRGSGPSYSSFARKERRRRRRSTPLPSQGPPVRRVDSKYQETSRPFQCTFCVDTFRTKYDWMRHEKSLHLNLEKWICCPNGPVEPCPSGHTTVCAYCRMPEPTAEHIEYHDHSTCDDKGLNARTFTRKDHLRQHLRLVHHVKFDRAMEEWKAVPDVLRSRCGFCDAVFESWDERAAHLSKHFREGKTMGEWTGGWGFDPEVACHVADAMTPFMIEAERAKPLPWSVEKGDVNMYDDLQREHGKGPQGSSSKGWEVMGAVLSDYVTQCRERGEEITDQRLQKYARQCLYGSDDTWNQTRADDPQWLALFKERLGLGCDDELAAAEAIGLAQAHPIEATETTAPFLAADLGVRSAPNLDLSVSAAEASDRPEEAALYSTPMDDGDGGIFQFEDTPNAENASLSQLDFHDFDLGLDEPLMATKSHDEAVNVATGGVDFMLGDMIWSAEGEGFFRPAETP